MVNIHGENDLLAKKLIKRNDISKQNLFTTSDAIRYWEGYLDFNEDAESTSSSAHISSAEIMFYKGYENGDLEIREFVDSDAMNLRRGFPIERFVVTREALIRFAYVIEEYPLFLFPDGEPDEAQKEKERTYDNSQRADNAVDGSQSIVDDVHSYLDGLSVEERKRLHNGEKYNVSGILDRLTKLNKKSVQKYSDGHARRLIKEAVLKLIDDDLIEHPK